MEAQVEGNSLINYESVYINDYVLYICYLKGVKKCLDTIYMLLTDPACTVPFKRYIYSDKKIMAFQCIPHPRYAAEKGKKFKSASLFPLHISMKI